MATTLIVHNRDSQSIIYSLYASSFFFFFLFKQVFILSQKQSFYINVQIKVYTYICLSVDTVYGIFNIRPFKKWI